MSERATFDVAVVGLGPGGASAARIAAQAGLRVFGCERNAVIGEPVQCAEFVPMPMLPYVHAPGVRIQQIEAMKTGLPSGQVVTSAFPGLMIDRGCFDRAIAARAEEAGAVLRAGLPLRRLEAGSGETVRLVCGPAGAETSIQARWVIAADGPHSPVAACLGLPPLRTVQTRQYTVPLLTSYADTDIWLSDDYPGGYGWLFPKGSVANVGLGADRQFTRDLRTPLAALHRQLIGEGLIGERILGRTGGAIPVSGLRPRLWEGQAIFVGDAAGLTHPITGAGIAPAVVSGEAAGRAVVGVLGGDSGALVEYDEDMRDHFGPALERALARRGELDRVWHTPKANDDATMRRGWIAFEEYFESSPRPSSQAVAALS